MSTRPLSAQRKPKPRWSTWWLAIRPKTLPAAAAPVIIGSALAYTDGSPHYVAGICALVSALFIQIGTNFYNDYSDAKSGADTSERIGPLRVTQAGLVSDREMLGATVVAFGFAILSGAYLMMRGGLPIVAIGFLAILFGFLYSTSRFSLSSFGLADLSALLFFGPIAVGGAYYVQSLQVSSSILVAGLAPGLLAAGLLAVNNVRDIEQDRVAGRRTLIVRFGRTFGVLQYAFCLTVAGLIPLLLVVGFEYSPHILVASVILIPALPMVGKLARSRDGRSLNTLLASTGKVLIAYSILFSLGVLVA